jgi:cytochrome c-type biogenesis protein
MNVPGLLSAAIAGLLSFLSPCVIPLVPAYLSFISGASIQSLSSKEARGRVFARSLFFAAGFTLAFVAFGIAFSGSAMFIGQGGSKRAVGIAGGILVILFGLNMIFDLIKPLGRDTRLLGRFSGRKTAGNLGALALGLAFAAGWSPCIGPILSSILIYASRQENIPKAAGLMLAYSAGFALPFLAAGLFFDRVRPMLAFFSRHGKIVRYVSGTILIFFGAAMATGSLTALTAFLSRF